jgi:ribosomal protein L10
VNLKKYLIFFYYLTNLNSKNQLKLERKLFSNNLKLFKNKNKITYKIIKTSIFYNLSTLIKGPLCIIKNTQNNNIDIQKLINLNPIVPLLAIKLNKKIYSNTQIKYIPTLNYKNNIQILNKTFKQLLKLPYTKLKNKTNSK